MKRQLLFSTGILLALTMNSQTVPNGGFENWTTISSLDPLNYPRTSNDENAARGYPANLFRVTDSQQGQYAIKLQTITAGTDTSFGYFVDFNPDNMSGGIPYSQHPASISGYYKCSVPVGDTAIFMVAFKQNGILLSMDIYKFYGVHNSYTPFTLVLNLPASTPDSVMVGAASSNAFVSRGIPGSMLQLDNLVFNGVTSQPSQLNGSFENWTTRTFYSPVQWATDGDTIFRSTNSHSGTYALKLTTLANDSTHARESVATTGHMTNNGPRGGLPFTQMSDTLCGWYKFIPNGTDSAGISFQASANGNPVGGAYGDLPPAVSYTYFQFPISCFMQPDSALLTFTSSNNNALPSNAGSVLYVDDIFLKSQPLNVQQIQWNAFGTVTLYPNPSYDGAWLEFTNRSYDQVIVTVTDAGGRKISEQKFPGYGQQRYFIDTAAMTSGIYFITIEQAANRVTRKMMVQ